MCGIAGILSRDAGPVPEARVRAMLAAMAHRGPDAEGVWTRDGLALGHRRLKILDPSDAANQPYTDGRDALVFNGEIFNHAALRDELSPRYEFRTRSDTEVLFRALQQWGTGALERIEGQFAFAFHQASTRSLLLARDHVGICPLYVRETADAVCFASEIKPLLSLGACAADPQGIVDYFTYRYCIQSGRTLFAGVRRFPPAHFQIVRAAGVVESERRYWRLAFSRRRRSGADAQAEFNRLWEGEISAQRMGDVPVGLYLSGGIDSGALLAGFAKTTRDIQAYTLRFSPEDPDGSRALAIGCRHGVRNHLVEFSAAALEPLEEVVRSVEEPFGDLIIAANYLLAKSASSRVRVVLSGEGGDEVFCGYDHQRAFLRLAGLHAGPLTRLPLAAALAHLPARLVGLASAYPGTFGAGEQRRIRDVFGRLTDPAGAYVALVSLFAPAELDGVLSEGFRRRHGVEPDTGPLREIFAAEPSPWQAVMRAEIEQLTLVVNLLKQDRFGMRFSLEGRVPFVSRRMLQFAGSLSPEELFAGASKRYVQGYAGSEKIAKRPFSLLSGGLEPSALAGLMDRYLTEQEVRDGGVLSWEGVTRVRLQAQRGGMLAVKQAMALLVFAVWWRCFMAHAKSP